MPTDLTAVMLVRTDWVSARAEHVSECAQTSLGKRANAPEVTCSHDGHTHVFASFGEMVQHMHEHPGG